MIKYDMNEINDLCDYVTKTILDAVEDSEWAEEVSDIFRDAEEYGSEYFDNFFYNYDSDCWSSGCSKFVYMGNPDYVVKFLFNTDFLPNYESTIYESAKKIGLEKYFAESIYVKTLEIGNCEVPVEIQAKADTSWATDNRKERILYNATSGHRLSKTRQKMRDSIEKDTFFYITFIATCPEDDSRKMIRFLNENGINDLHSANYTLKKGMPFVFDYSGYRL